MALPSSSVTFSNQTLIPSLPNDISIQILARVPRSDHPSLSLVSKAFRSLLTSPLFVTTRSLINSTTETCLFVTLRLQDNEEIVPRSFTDHLFTLRGRHLVPLPRIPRCHSGSTYATCGPCIYVLGSNPDTEFDSVNDVWIFDCRFNKWAAGPSMHIPKGYPIVGVVDGKLHVIPRYDVDNGEVYDPDMGTWETTECVRGLGREETLINASARVGRKIYGVTSCLGPVVSYDVDTKFRDIVTCTERISDCFCIIDGVMYGYDFLTGTIKGFDLEEEQWKEVRGVESDMWDNAGDIHVVNIEGKLAMLWRRQNVDNAKNCWEVWYMEVDVEKEENGELRGNVCSKELVLNFPYIGGSSPVEVWNGLKGNKPTNTRLKKSTNMKMLPDDFYALIPHEITT